MPNGPLRPRTSTPDDEGPHSPEALMISALLHQGTFSPEAYNVDVEMLACYDRLWRFCETYQRQAGCAPPLELITKKHPDFVYTDAVDATWAARELHKAHALREIRRKVRDALRHVEAEELQEAYDVLAEMPKPRIVRAEPTSILDHSLLDEEEESLAIDVPFRTLGMATGGIRSSELWFLASRPWVGKSTIAGQFCKTGSLAGFKVRWITTEMPKREVATRLWRDLAGRDAELRAQLDSEDVYERKAALDTLAARLPAIPDIVDRRDGPITMDTVSQSLEEADLTILDHIGHLKTASGARMVDDHRIMAATSNQLREETIRTNGACLTICHVNRAGDSKKVPPKLVDLAESDWLSRDGVVVVTMCAPSETTRMYSLEKNRHGRGAIWWSRYLPESARYEEISPDLASDLKLVDEERTNF